MKRLFEDAQLMEKKFSIDTFIVGTSAEMRKAKHKWTMSERKINALIGRLNREYSVWEGNLKWFQNRRGEWSLYVTDPNRPGMQNIINQIDRDMVALVFEILGHDVDADPAKVEQARNTNNHWEMGATEVVKFKKLAGSQFKYVDVVHDRSDHTYPFFVFMKAKYDKQPYISRMWNVWGRVLGVKGDLHKFKRRQEPGTSL